MDAVRHILPDPRQYHPQASLTNRLIHHAQSALDAPSADDREMWRQGLVGAMDEMLQRRELLSISVALAMREITRGIGVLIPCPTSDAGATRRKGSR